MKKIQLILCFCIALPTIASAQINSGQTAGGDSLNTITTAVPFLRIPPDARSAAMGDAGLAISPDANAIFWNAAKLVFTEKTSALSLTYTPWLRGLANDIYLLNASGYYKVAKNQAIAASLTYFSLGNIQFTDLTGANIGQSRPNEFAFNFAYSRSLSKYLSTGISLKFLRSDLANGQTAIGGGVIKAGIGASADVSVFYKKPMRNDIDNLSFGAAITNVGSKISYTDDNQTRDFQPTNLGIGAAYTHRPNDHHELTGTIDINKLLVPSPTTDADSNKIIDSREKGIVSGMFSSFGDAPGGGKEEFRELMYSIGAEYVYDKQFSLRAGYYSEHATKGNRKFLTLGAGFRFKIMNINLSYLVPTNGQQSPLSNTFRISLMFDFE
jgi:hypothetical protein